jgi:hypothetical protein
MQMLYNSDSYVVVHFELPAEATAPGGSGLPGRSPAASAGEESPTPLTRAGFEIVDKHARREIFIEGAVALSFEQGVQALARDNPSEEAFDEFIGRYCTMAQHPVALH